LELLSHANFDSGKSISDFEDEPEVMMLDFSDKNIYEEMVKQEQKRREESKKRASGSSNQQNRGSNSNNGGRKRNLKRPTPKKKKGSRKGEKRESGNHLSRFQEELFKG